MHYYALVQIDPDSPDTMENQIAALMAPYIETYDEITEKFSGFWDWYSIGGRWTGHLSDYDPTKDRRNMKVCWLCHGTGMRDDKLGQDQRAVNPEYTCNGCDGTGIMLKFASEWVAPEDGNMALRRDVPEGKKPYTLVTPEGAWEKETYVSTGNWKTSYFKPNPEFEDAWENLDLDATLVVVDYHC